MDQCCLFCFSVVWVTSDSSSVLLAKPLIQHQCCQRLTSNSNNSANTKKGITVRPVGVQGARSSSLMAENHAITPLNNFLTFVGTILLKETEENHYFSPLVNLSFVAGSRNGLQQTAVSYHPRR
jgi:hypothetical protein